LPTGNQRRIYRGDLGIDLPPKKSSKVISESKFLQKSNINLKLAVHLANDANQEVSKLRTQADDVFKERFEEAKEIFRRPFCNLNTRLRMSHGTLIDFFLL